MKKVINFIGLEDVVSEYRIFEGYIRKNFNIECYMSDRVMREVIELHVSAVLDERIFNLFRKFVDGWEFTLLEIVTANRLNDGDLKKLYNSKIFRTLNSNVAALVNTATASHDPNFTIWDVNVTDELDTVAVTMDGDYRIEQWHKEHSVTRLNVTDTMTVDIGHIHQRLKEVLKYNYAPAYIKPSKYSRNTVHKQEYYSKAVAIILNHLFKNTFESVKGFDKVIGRISELGLIDNPMAIGEHIFNYIRFELLDRIDKLSGMRSVSSYTIVGEEIVINFGSNKTVATDGKTFSQLEVALAEANGDYIPERLRGR